MSFFTYERDINFYETDMMGIVHHANYLRIYEEARVAWARDRKLISNPVDASQFAVLTTHVKHIRPARFGQRISIQVQARAQGARIILEYKMLLKGGEILSEARTEHVAIDIGGDSSDTKGSKFKLAKPTALVAATMEKEPWTETWLSSL